MKTSKKTISICVKIFFLLIIYAEGFSQNELNLAVFNKARCISTFDMFFDSKPKENKNEESLKMKISPSSTKYLQIKEYVFKSDEKKGGIIIESKITKIKTEQDNSMTKTIYDSENVFERDASATLLANEYDPLINKPLKVRYEMNGIPIDTIIKSISSLDKKSIVLSNLKNWSYLFIHVPEDFVWKEKNSWKDSLLVDNVLVEAAYEVLSIQNGMANLSIKGLNSPQKTFSLRSKPTKVKDETTMTDSIFEGKMNVNIKNILINELELNLNNEISFDAMGQRITLVNEQKITVKNQLIKN